MSSTLYPSNGSALLYLVVVVKRRRLHLFRATQTRRAEHLDAVKTERLNIAKQQGWKERGCIARTNWQLLPCPPCLGL